jgi:DNA invertase Pin-like site-specific DNA recombinase
MLIVLGGLAEFKHELIRARTGEGRDRAVANNVTLGRKQTFTHQQKQEAIKCVKAGKETQGEIARSYSVSRWTISRLDR